MYRLTSFITQNNSNVPVKRDFFLLNAALAMTNLNLISLVHLVSRDCPLATQIVVTLHILSVTVCSHSVCHSLFTLCLSQSVHILSVTVCSHSVCHSLLTLCLSQSVHTLSVTVCSHSVTVCSHCLSQSVQNLSVTVCSHSATVCSHSACQFVHILSVTVSSHSICHSLFTVCLSV
jgi:hypothetical protein